MIHAWELFGELTLRGRSVLANKVDRLVLKEEQAHRHWLNEALERKAIMQNEVQLHLHKGEAKMLIPTMAKNDGHRFVGNGNRGSNRDTGVFGGNTADSVLRHVECSVLQSSPRDS